MPKVDLPYSVTVGIGTERHDLVGGEQEVTEVVKKALIEAGVLDVEKKTSSTTKE